MSMLLKKLRGNKKGFSLVELVIVIAIMAVLIAILVPQYLKYVERSRESKDAAQADEILRAVQVSLADETAYRNYMKQLEITDSTSADIEVTITWQGNGNGIVFNGKSATAVDFIDEVAAALSLPASGSTIKSADGSKPGKSAAASHVGWDYVITVTYKNATKILVVTGEWKDSGGSTPPVGEPG